MSEPTAAPAAAPEGVTALSANMARAAAALTPTARATRFHVTGSAEAGRAHAAAIATVASAVGSAATALSSRPERMDSQTAYTPAARKRLRPATGEKAPPVAMKKRTAAPPATTQLAS